jgi:hypothetical protein
MGNPVFSSRYLELPEKDRAKVDYIITYLNTESVAEMKRILFAIRAEIDIRACLPVSGSPCLQEPQPANQ